jgi:hypothetical protein
MYGHFAGWAVCCQARWTRPEARRMLDHCMLEQQLEALIAHATAADSGVDLARARAAFEERTGPFEPGEPWYEQRIRCFLDFYVCDWEPSRSLLDAAPLSELERAVAVAARRSVRGLYEILEDEPELRLRDMVGGARFRIARDTMPPSDVRAGETFDGRLIVLDGRIHLAPGIIFHPAEARAPLVELLGPASSLDRIEALDALLRMRMRLDRFTSMRARHIYRAEALADRDILSAAWARDRPGRDIISNG